MQKVLVLDANQRSALAVIRSLGRHGIPVIAADQEARPLGGASRYAVASVQYPDPAKSPRLFLDAIAAIVHAHGVDIVVPATDLTTMLLVEQPEYVQRARLAAPPAATYETLTDKRRLVELAGRLGVTAPETRVATSAAEIEAAAPELGFPLVLKPARSRYLKADQVISTAVRIVNRPDELDKTTASLAWLRDIPCLVQRFVPGQGAGIFALYGESGPLAWFAHKRIREKPPSGGVSVLSESADVDSRMKNMAMRLLSASHWVGVAMIEYRVTPAGDPYLMEVNGRFWGSLQLAIDSGVDFPWLLHQLVSGAAPEAPSSYSRGRRLRWLLGDVDNLILQLRAGEPGNGGKARAAARFLASFVDLSCQQEVFRWSDPGPGLREARHWIGALRR
jgi:predicted ATP-grasp superfamily ATP-dependent carboligase